MAKIPQITESTRGLSVPNVAFTPQDHGAEQLMRSVGRLGDGMQQVAMAFHQQRSQEEVATGSVEFNKGLIDIQAQAMTMPVDESIDFVQKESDALAQSISSNFKSETAKTHFLNIAKEQSVKMYGGFVGRKLTVELANTKVKMRMAIEDALRTGNDVEAKKLIVAATSAGIMSPEETQASINYENAFREKLAILANSDDLPKLRSMTLETRSARELQSDVIFRLQTREKALDKGLIQLKTINEVEEDVTQSLASGKFDLATVKWGIREHLKKSGQYEDVEIEQIVMHYSKALEKSDAYYQVRSGKLSNFTPSQVNKLYPSLGIDDVNDISEMSSDLARKSQDKKQSFVSTLIDQRIRSGMITKDTVDSSDAYWNPILSELVQFGMTDMQAAEVRSLLSDRDITSDSIKDLKSRGIISSLDAGELNVRLMATKAGSGKKLAEAQKVEQIIHAKSKGDKLAVVSGDIDINNHYKVKHLQNETLVNLFDGPEAELFSRLESVMTDMNRMGKVYPQFLDEMRDVLNSGDPQLAVIVAQGMKRFITPNSREYMTDSPIHHSIDNETKGLVDALGGIKINLGDGSKIDPKTLRESVEMVRTRNLLDSETAISWDKLGGQKTIVEAVMAANRNYPPQAIDLAVRLARDQFNRNSSIEDSKNFALAQIGKMYHSNGYGQMVTFDVLKIGERQGIAPGNVDDQTISRLAFHWLGYEDLSEDDLAEHIQRFVDVKQLPGLHPKIFGNEHYQKAILKTPNSGPVAKWKDSPARHLSRDDMSFILMMAGVRPHKFQVTAPAPRSAIPQPGEDFSGGPIAAARLDSGFKAIPLASNLAFEKNNPDITVRLKNWLGAKVKAGVIGTSLNKDNVADPSGQWFTAPANWDVNRARKEIHINDTGGSIFRVDSNEDAKRDGTLMFDIEYYDEVAGWTRLERQYTPKPSFYLDQTWFFDRYRGAGEFFGDPKVQESVEGSKARIFEENVEKAKKRDWDNGVPPFFPHGG